MFDRPLYPPYDPKPGLDFSRSTDATKREKWRIAKAFGKHYGWTLSESSGGAGLYLLAKGKRAVGGEAQYRGLHDYRTDVWDHTYYYRVNQRMAAVATHPYPKPDDLKHEAEFARKYQLLLWYPNYPSWYYPGHSRLVVYMGPAHMKALHAVDDFFWLVEQQIPERLRGRIDVNVTSDPFHIKTIAVFTDKAVPARTYECELELIRPDHDRSLALKIPDLALATICAFFG